MSLPVALSKPEDSKFFSVSYEDPSMKVEMDGGYTLSRARHTRTPRRHITTGYSNLTDADRGLLETFYNSQRGGSKAFSYTNPISGEVITVRFDGPIVFTYAGVGSTVRWNVANIKLAEI